MPLTTSPETKLCNTRTCYLLTKSNNPVTIENSKEDIKSAGALTSGTQMSIIKLTSSKDNHVFICCFGTKQSSTVKDHTPESQTSPLNCNAPWGNTSPSIISQSDANAAPETFPTIGCSQETKTNQRDIQSDALHVAGINLPATETDNDSPTINASVLSATNVESDIDPIKHQSIPSNIHHECKVSQREQSKPSTTHTACHTIKSEQTQASPAAGYLSATNAEYDNIGHLESLSRPSNIHHQYKTSQVGKRTQLGTIQQSNSEGVSDNSPLDDRLEPSLNHNHFKTRQCDHVTTQLNTIQESVFRPVSKHGTVEKCCFKTDSAPIGDHRQSENGQTSSPQTHKKLPFHDHSTTSTKESAPESYYLDTGSWDPLCHHIEYHEKSMALPRDLRCLKESELLPMAYDDFTKCLEDENLCCSAPKMMTSDDDGVVPSSSPLLSGNEGRCYVNCSDSSTDGSQEYTWECFSARDENIYKSPSLAHTDYPQYGTLNWGLAPTIIYKTPKPDTSLPDVGNDYMKCSISAGNVELLTPPPPNYKKRLGRSRRRMERRHVKRRRIYFRDDENCQGLQEVPVNEGEKDGEQSLDTDFIPDDPMWFEDELDEKEFIDSNDKSFGSVSEQDIADCYESLRNILPNSEGTTGTYRILTEAVEDIKNWLEETLDDFNTGRDENVELIKEEESDKPIELKSCEDVLEILPQYSWNEIDEPSYEIQEILNSVAKEGSMDNCEELAITELQDEIPDAKPTKRKRNRSSSRKRKMPRKQNKFQHDDSNDAGNSNSQRGDCESVFDDSMRSNSSSRSNSRGGRCVTPIYPKPTPGVLLSPSLAGFIPLQIIGKPLILPKPHHRDDCFSPSSVHSPLTSPQLLPSFRVISTASSIPVPEPATLPLPQFFPDITSCSMTRSQWLRSVIKVPARVWKKGELKCVVEKGSQKKTIPNGYMLYCKERRNCLVKQNHDLKPGEITKLLSENWNQLSEEKRRPYVEEAMKLRHDENEWINQTLG